MLEIFQRQKHEATTQKRNKATELKVGREHQGIL